MPDFNKELPKIKKVSVLVLEDDVEALSLIFKIFTQLWELAEFHPVVLSKYSQVEKWINNSDAEFDLILLDRDCAEGGSFHVLDIEKIGPEKIIAISMHHPYNEEARKRGVTKVVLKTFEDLRKFEDGLFAAIEKFVREIK